MVKNQITISSVKSDYSLLAKLYKLQKSLGPEDSFESKEDLEKSIDDYIEWVRPLFPQNTPIDSLLPPLKTGGDVRRFNRLYRALEAAFNEQSFIDRMSSWNPQLILTLSNQCDKGCTHCAPDSKINGEVMPYEKIVKLDPRYFGIFNKVAIGRKGEPMIYNSSEHDLGDVVEYLAEQEVREITFSLGVFKKQNPKYDEVSEKLSNTRKRFPNLSLGTRLSYHAYLLKDMSYSELEKYTEAFRYTIDRCANFSDQIIISIQGDEMFPLTHIRRVSALFDATKEKIFEGFEVSSTDGQTNITKNGKSTQLFVQPPTPIMYPKGRFARKLRNEGRYEEYEKLFASYEDSNYLKVCPILLNYQDIIVEPNGDTLVCISFLGIGKPPVTNIFNHTYDEVMEHLNNRFELQKTWLLGHLPEVVHGKISTCEYKNNCYGSR